MNARSIIDMVVKTAVNKISTNEVQKYQEPGEELLATNDSFWSWEDDSNYRNAYLFIKEDDGNLRLVVVETHTKYGLGAGTRTAILLDESVGTILKPDTTKIVSILAKHSHQKSTAGRGFKRLWTNPKTNQRESLKDIIKQRFM